MASWVFCLMVSHEAAIKMSSRAGVSCEDLTGGRSPFELTFVIVGSSSRLLDRGP